MVKNIYIIAGCNGAGKTTASYTILPELHCLEFVNADEIAKGLSPFQPEKVAIQAGKLMLQRIDKLLENNISFAFETTLSSKSYKNMLLKAKQNGYNINLLFFWLQTVELAKERVAKRVSEGGHNIDKNVIERRYYRGIQNLFEIYIEIADGILIFDNSENERELIVKKVINKQIEILNHNKYNLLKEIL
ncbi:MAG: zeta toxin family protein [Prevotellaceae bacterium]|jgi:predicted ABC-type ATPase|nr:zeta toxin family protein [Prevotellaceae bacterium]